MRHLHVALAVVGLLLVSEEGARLAQTIPESPQPKAQAALRDDDSTLNDARRLIHSGDFRAAEPMLRTSLKANDQSADAHTMLGYALMRLNRPKESLAEYTRAAQLRTPSAEDLRAVGDDYALLEDFTDADHWMSRSLVMNESDPETWYSLGRVRYSLQRFREAAQCFQKTLELLPRSVKAANNLGLAYEGLNRTSDAVREYRRALEWQAGSSHPSEQPMLNLAIVLVHQGKLDEALPLLKQATLIAPEDPRINDQLGHLYLQQGALGDSQREFERAVALSPQSGAYHFLLGQVYRRQGLATLAEAEFRRAQELNGSHSSAP